MNTLETNEDASLKEADKPESRPVRNVEKLEQTKKLFLEIVTGLPEGIGQQLIAYHLFYHEYR